MVSGGEENRSRREGEGWSLVLRGHRWFGAADGRIEMETGLSCLLSLFNGCVCVCVCLFAQSIVPMMTCITVKREQEGLSGSLFGFKSWHVAPHSRFSKYTHTLTFTLAHTHTHSPTWLISSAFTASQCHGNVPLKAKGVETRSPGLPGLSLVVIHTQMLYSQGRVGSGMDFTESDSGSAYRSWCV